METTVRCVFLPDLRGRADLNFWNLDLKNPTNLRQEWCRKGGGVVGAKLRWGKTTKH